MKDPAKLIGRIWLGFMVGLIPAVFCMCWFIWAQMPPELHDPKRMLLTGCAIYLLFGALVSYVYGLMYVQARKIRAKRRRVVRFGERLRGE